MGKVANPLAAGGSFGWDTLANWRSGSFSWECCPASDNMEFDYSRATDRTFALCSTPSLYVITFLR